MSYYLIRCKWNSYSYITLNSSPQGVSEGFYKYPQRSDSFQNVPRGVSNNLKMCSVVFRTLFKMSPEPCQTVFKMSPEPCLPFLKCPPRWVGHFLKWPPNRVWRFQNVPRDVSDVFKNVPRYELVIFITIPQGVSNNFNNVPRAVSDVLKITRGVSAIFRHTFLKMSDTPLETFLKINARHLDTLKSPLCPYKNQEFCWQMWRTIGWWFISLAHKRILRTLAKHSKITMRTIEKINDTADELHFLLVCIDRSPEQRALKLFIKQDLFNFHRDCFFHRHC